MATKANILVKSINISDIFHQTGVTVGHARFTLETVFTVFIDFLPMIIRIVRMTFRQDAVEEFLSIFESSKEKIRNFAGCQHLELLQDMIDENVYSTYSWWGKQIDLDNYRKSKLFGQVWPKTKRLFDAPPSAISYRQKIKLD